MNLITDLWIPVRLADGTRTTIRPSEITDRSNPPVALDAPRADFNSALAQFLIGLLQTAFAPGDGDEWIHRLEEPPCVEMLDQAFGGHADAFVLNGEGPRFMQDLERFDQGGTDKRKPAKKNSVASLLIDTPGDKTLKNNADHFIKRDRIEALCPACAATALFTLQINAPGGGAGHRTSLRGGGPLTTLVALDPEGSELPDTLWHNLWLNVLPRTVRLTGNPVLTDPEHIFPWLATTRTSNPKEGGLDTTPEDAHPLQMYWAMPRRIRLDFENTTRSTTVPTTPALGAIPSLPTRNRTRPSLCPGTHNREVSVTATGWGWSMPGKTTSNVSFLPEWWIPSCVNPKEWGRRVFGPSGTTWTT